ncbi:MAG: 4Fe-4S dicluster domain-containing protein [Mariprofundales bacterium]|nr:4Fe-4S dicluster domain-containing protein [Mariprofundales bacterium]
MMTLCHSCRLCDLSCAAWRVSRDGESAPRALVLMEQRQQSISSWQLAFCTLCGACDAACPVGVQPMSLIVQQGEGEGVLQRLSMASSPTGGRQLILSAEGRVAALFPDRERLDDCGADIVQALAANRHVSVERRRQFVEPLLAGSSVVVADGLLYYTLRRWLPSLTLVTLAEALLPRMAHHLRPGDLLLLDAPAFNVDQERLLPLIQRAVMASGAMINLDLQRLATPLRSYRAGSEEALAARWQWLRSERGVERVVVENPDDVEVVAAVGELPVLWLGELSGSGSVEAGC